MRLRLCDILQTTGGAVNSSGVMLVLAASYCVFAADYKPTAADEQSVRKVVDAYAKAGQNLDASNLPSLFSDDADVRGTGGQWLSGRDNIVTDQAEFFNTLKARAERPKQNPGPFPDQIRFISADVALYDASHIRERDGSRRLRMISAMLRKEAGSWKIVAIRLSESASTE